MGVCFKRPADKWPLTKSTVKRRPKPRLSTAPVHRDRPILAQTKHLFEAPNSPLPATEYNELTEVRSRGVIEGVLLKEGQPGFQDKPQVSRGDLSLGTLPCSRIGVACKKGLKSDSHNQDDFSITIDPDFQLFCVFDGHGAYGHEVSHYVKKTLPELLSNSPKLKIDPEGALRTVFLETNKRLSEECQLPHVSYNCCFSGTTATVALVVNDTLYIAHVGDSRAVVSGKTKSLLETTDHKPNLPNEQTRIIQSGGEVKKLPNDIPYRVFKKESGKPGLSISRALGDECAASVGVSAAPEILQIPIDQNSERLLICSDGVWEFLSNQEAMDIVNKSQENCRVAAEQLASVAWMRWIQEEEDVVDDITVIIVNLHRI